MSSTYCSDLCDLFDLLERKDLRDRLGCEEDETESAGGGTYCSYDNNPTINCSCFYDVTYGMAVSF